MGRLRSRLDSLFKRLRRYADRPWFLPLNALLAALDYFVAVIPTDGLLVSCTLLSPRRWLRNSLWFIGGSTAGAFALAEVVARFGEAFIEQWMSGIARSGFWQQTTDWISQHGLWALAALAASPMALIPAVAICALAKMPVLQIGLAVFAGRLIKYPLLAWLSAYAPHWLGRVPMDRG